MKRSEVEQWAYLDNGRTTTLRLDREKVRRLARFAMETMRLLRSNHSEHDPQCHTCALLAEWEAK